MEPSPAAQTPPSTRSVRIPDGERIYAIGDIHGRLDLFEALVARIRHDNAARGPAQVSVILLGDIIDRGPDSAEMVARCRGLTRRTGAFQVLKGNHEAMMVDSLRGNLMALALWLRSGGDAALRSWGVDQALIEAGPSHDLIVEAKRLISADDLAWLDALPIHHIAGDYLFVHAGIRPGVPIARQSTDDMLWIRREFLESEDDHPHMIVHGHSIIDTGVRLKSNRVGIDTGAYRTNILTALMVEEDRHALLSTGDPDRAATAA